MVAPRSSSSVPSARDAKGIFFRCGAGTPPASADDVRVGNSGGGTVQVDEMLLSRYASGL